MINPNPPNKTPPPSRYKYIYQVGDQPLNTKAVPWEMRKLANLPPKATYTMSNDAVQFNSNILIPEVNKLDNYSTKHHYSTFGESLIFSILLFLFCKMNSSIHYSKYIIILLRSRFLRFYLPASSIRLFLPLLISLIWYLFLFILLETDGTAHA